MSVYVCIYCGRASGGMGTSDFSTKATSPTVCDCLSPDQHDEAKELAAGLRPWHASRTRGKRVAPEIRAAANEQWDAQQKWIAEYNRTHAGVSR